MKKPIPRFCGEDKNGLKNRFKALWYRGEA